MKMTYEAIIRPVFKKGNRLNFKNYIGISLIDTVYMIFAIAISGRLPAERMTGEYQSGFRPGRSTTDHIFSLDRCWKRLMSTT